jgi:PAS domain S-box-containing protein
MYDDQHAGHPQGLEPDEGGAARILLIDADAAARAANARLLRDAGYAVFEAGLGAVGLRLLRARHPDVVLIDESLPDIDNPELVRRIKAEPELADIIVVQLSAQPGAPAGHAGGVDPRADGRIACPTGDPELLARMQGFLGQKQVEHKPAPLALRAPGVRRRAPRRQRGAPPRRATRCTRGALQVLPPMLAQASIGAAMIGLDGRFIDANPACCRIVGRTLAELRALRISGLMCAGDRTTHARRLDRALAHDPGTFNAQLRFVRKDGTIARTAASFSIARDARHEPLHVLGIFEDLSQRDKAAAEVQRSLSLLEMAGRMARVGGWSIELPERRLLWSDVVATIHEEAPGFSPSLGGGLDYFAPGDRGVIDAALERCIADGTPYDLEVEKVSARGRRIWVRTIGKAERDPQGRIVRIQGAIQEITERKLAEESMREGEERFSGAFEQAPSGVALVAPDGRWLRVNQALCGLLGYSEAELLGRSFQDITHPDDLELDMAHVRRMLAGDIRTYQLEKRYRHARGHFVPTMLSVSLVRDARHLPRYFISHVLDITERKRSEQAIESTLQRLNEAQRIGQIGDWEWDFATRTITWSPQVFAILGLDPRLGPPSTYEEISAIYDPASSALMDDKVRQAVETGLPQTYELVAHRPDGQRVDVVAMAVPRKGPDGKVAVLYGTMQDTTERKRAEKRAETDLHEHLAERQRDQDALLQLNMELEGRVLARTAELNLSRNDAEQANQAKSAFLAAMSHEIRTPMNGVIGMLDVLQQTRLKNEQAEMVDLIRDSAFSLLGIIEDVLDFSRIEAGKLEISVETMDVGSMVERVCGMLGHLAVKQGVSLSVFVDPAIPRALAGDEGRVRQVLVNLVGNAIKFSAGRPQAGWTSMRALLVACDARWATVDLIVADNGIGIDAAAQSRLFAPFAQADASTTRRYGGTGLGLVISKALVQLMGGRISVRSAPGQGSTFSVRLRFAIPDLPAADAGTDADAAGMLVEGLRCRIVGAEQPLVDDLCAYLDAAGALVERSPDLAAAAATEEATPPPGPTPWLIMPSQPPLALAELRMLARRPPAPPTCFIVFGRGRRRRPRMAACDLINVDLDAMSRQVLYRALALAAGRAQDDPSDDEPDPPADRAPLPPAADGLQERPLVLVADDNETNRQVIMRQLQLVGYSAEVCIDGRAALERWRSGDFALLLTDLHMPVMDGYALAAAIRAEEDGARRTPIIALTANALRDEKLRCREVGIDTYLTKPVRLLQLKAALEEALGPAGHPEHALPGAAAAGTAVDLGVLADLIGDEAAEIDEVLRAFVTSAEALGSDLVQAAGGGAPQAAADAAHTLKSSARTIGALPLGDLCARIETAGRIGNVHTVDALLPGFQRELRAVLGFLAARRARAFPDAARSP